MRCVSCKKPADIKITQAFCKECFLKHYQRRVERTIKKFKLIGKKDKVLIAVSGGKDSLSCADVLWRLGFDVSVLHIDVGIKKCTNPRTKRVVEQFCKERRIPFYFTSFEEFFEIDDINKFFKAAKRPICATCGMLKRALFNKFARINDFTKIATGHCADDIVKYFFKTMISGDKDSILWLSKLKPITPSLHPKIVTRIRPLFEILEIENLAYTKFRNIVVAGCVQCSYFQRKDKWTESLREIDKRMPDFKIKIAKTLEKINISLEGTHEKEGKIKECKVCGEPTSEEICAICKIKERMKKVLDRKLLWVYIQKRPYQRSRMELNSKHSQTFMKICITSQGKNLNSIVDPRFGRCQHFVFLNDKGKIEKVIENAGSLAQRGAGIAAAQNVVSNGAEVVITGNMGPHAFSVLSQSGVKIYFAPPASTVKEAFLMWKEKKLSEATAPVSGPGFGGRGLGGGRRGFGRGMGRGLGRFFRGQ